MRTDHARRITPGSNLSRTPELNSRLLSWRVEFWEIFVVRMPYLLLVAWLNTNPDVRGFPAPGKGNALSPLDGANSAETDSPATCPSTHRPRPHRRESRDWASLIKISGARRARLYCCPLCFHRSFWLPVIGKNFCVDKKSSLISSTICVSAQASMEWEAISFLVLWRGYLDLLASWSEAKHGVSDAEIVYCVLISSAWPTL